MKRLQTGKMDQGKKRDKTQIVTIWNEKEDITTGPRHRTILREYYLQFYADTFEILR